MDDHPIEITDQPAGSTGEVTFVEFPKARPKLDSDPPLGDEELALITWGGEGGGNLDYDPAKWGRRD